MKRPKYPRLARPVSLLLVAAALGFSATAEATLFDRGGGLIYDDDLNITWMQDALLAATNTFGVSGIQSGVRSGTSIFGPYTWSVDGRMDWYTAQNWIAAMNAANYLGYSDWRLPATLQPDPSCSYQFPGYSAGANCTGSEMGHLFYTELHNQFNTPANAGFLNSGPFNLPFNWSNMEAGVFWSDTYAPAPSYAWVFSWPGGSQSTGNKYYDYSYVYSNPQSNYGNFYAWAVRPGDVIQGGGGIGGGGGTTVPEPSTLLLLGSGIAGLAATRIRGRFMRKGWIFRQV